MIHYNNQFTVLYLNDHRVVIRMRMLQKVDTLNKQIEMQYKTMHYAGLHLNMYMNDSYYCK